MLGNIKEINLNWFSVVSPVSDKLGVGFGWFSKRAELEGGSGYSRLDTTGIGDNHFILGLGMKVYEDIGVGVNINRFVLTSSIEGRSGFGIDVGVRAQYPKSPIYVGLVMKNLTAGMGEETYPTTYRFGVAFLGLPRIVIKTYKKEVDGKVKRYRKRVKEGYRLAVSLDIGTKPGVVVVTSDGTKEGLIHYYFGVEYIPMKMFGLRFGYNDLDNLTAGIRLGYQKYFFDFSYSMGKKDTGLEIPILGPSYKLALTMEM
jgi:hypothetical protein